MNRTAATRTPAKPPPAATTARPATGNYAGFAVPGIPLARITAVELRKSVDTRAGFWLLMAVAIASLLTTAAVLAWAAPQELTQATFTTAISVPTSVILPVIAVLSVTSEWSQRTGLTTFTLVPHRGRVMLAKTLAATVIAVASTVVAFAAGAVGNVLGTGFNDYPTVWNQSAADVGLFTLGNVLIMLLGLVIGTLVRNSPGAIVTYFVYAFVSPPLLMLLAMHQQWFADAQPWVDANHAQEVLLTGALTGQQWTQLGVTTVVWLLLPGMVGTRNLLRSEVK